MFTAKLDTDAANEKAERIKAALAAGPGNPYILEGMREAQSYNMGFQRRQFSTASHGGGRWPDLAPSTKLRRARLLGLRTGRRGARGISIPDFPFAFPVLYISGLLYTSLEEDAEGHWWLVTENSVQSGTQVYYANFHQSGNERLPRREIITYPDAETLEKMGVFISAGAEKAILNA